jgi:hypothetical protein
MSTLMIYGLFPLFMEAEPVLLTISFAKTVWKTYWQLLYVHSNLFTDTHIIISFCTQALGNLPSFVGFCHFICNVCDLCNPQKFNIVQNLYDSLLLVNNFTWVLRRQSQCFH